MIRHLTVFGAGLATLVVVAAGLIIQAIGQDDQPARLPGRIAFVSDEDNNPGDIYVTDADGTRRIRLTRDPAYDAHPSWSPDGKEIAFWSTRNENAGDIYTMQSNGQGVMRLTRHLARDSHPAWSPDGERIAFVSTRDNNLGDIYVIRTDGTEPMRLTDDPRLETEPCWSPDGKRIAFTQMREGISSRIYVVPADGGTPAELVAADGLASEPAWCPVRNELVFVLSSGASNWGDIWFADALEGTILRKWRYQGRETGLAWSADGSMICCSHSQRPNGERADLIVFDLDTNDTIRVTRSRASDREPDWWQPAPEGGRSPSAPIPPPE